MVRPHIAPFGSWKSPITTDLIVSETIGLAQVSIDGQDIYWVEMRPSEGGRSVIMRRTSNGHTEVLTPPPFNVRTRVHEYGGGDYIASEGTIYFSNFVDQRIYRQHPGSEPQPITPNANMRYADGVIDRQRNRLVCVREDHTVVGREATNSLVSLALNGSDQKVIVSGNDFYSSPRLSPDGTQLAWLTWNHPNMPWDGNELWVGELTTDGLISHAECIAGGANESIFQPEWSPEGVLHFISDRTGWWNLYCWRNGNIIALCEKAAEFGLPQWVFGMSTYDFVNAHRIICSYTEQAIWRLASLDTTTGILSSIETPYSTIRQVRATAEQVVFIGGSPFEPISIMQLDLNTSRIEVLCRSSKVTVDSEYLSVPQTIGFPTEHGLTAYAFYYPPQNNDYVAPPGERPPLLVMSHGGPTGAASSVLDLEIQYWTSRGIAVLDVNYGGSTGYGKLYRERLVGQWGIVDVDDCVNGAKYLVDYDLVDSQRLMITGGSAGGYTTLCSLTFRDTFKAGASYFGLSDLEADLLETHKFESRYSFRLVAPYPEGREIYYERSPIHFTNRLSCPVIFFQGLEDKIVLPNQSELMVEALRNSRLPVAYLAFEGEGHGFRKAENIKHSLQAELYFYSRIFKFVLADPIEPIIIENL